MEKTYKRDIERAARVKKTAEIVGVSERHVRRVLSGDHDNDEIIATYMELLELEQAAYQTARQNHLLAAVEKLVPFNPKPNENN